MGFVYLLVVYVVSSVPAYVLGERRGVEKAWVAFVPLLGPTIVTLWTMERSGWLSILGVIPIVDIFFGIWLIVELPASHGRTRWWALALIVPLIGMLWYALTVDRVGGATATAST